MRSFPKTGETKQPGKKIKSVAIIAASIIALLIVTMIVGMSKSHSEKKVKVRYDGQTYPQQISDRSYGSTNSSMSYGGAVKELGVQSDGINSFDIAESAPQAPSMQPDQGIDGKSEPGNAETSVPSEEKAVIPDKSRKITHTYRYSAETDKFDECMEQIQKTLASTGGWIESSSTDIRTFNGYDGNARDVRMADLTIRVPADKAGEIKSAFNGENGIVLSENVSTQDMTTAYMDAGLQAEAYRSEYNRLLALMDDATTVTETMELQDRLSNLNYQIQFYEKQMENIDRDVEMSTIYLTLYEVQYYTATIGRYRFDFGQRLADEFENFVYQIPEFLFIMAYVMIGGLGIVMLLWLLAWLAIRTKNKSARENVIRIVDDRKQE